jgi:hypothetical protein
MSSQRYEVMAAARSTPTHHLEGLEGRATRRPFFPFASARPKIFMHEDNQTIVAVLRHLTSRWLDMLDEPRKVWDFIDTSNISICARYARYAANAWADKLSRETDMDNWHLKPASSLS